MKTTLAKSAGFCFGVKRAVDEVYKQIETGRKPVYTYGPVIHNEQVMSELESKGVRVIHTEEELEDIHEGTIIIRAHGVPRRMQEKLESLGVDVVDTTCPFVKKIHRIAEKETRQGKVLIIAGDPRHPEVQGIKGWAEGEVYIVENAEELAKIDIPREREVVLVAQTTFNMLKFQDIVDKIQKKYYNAYVGKTICSATADRQMEAGRIAAEVDAMIVIGGRHSSNTQKLYDICKAKCKNTYFIETLVDLETKPFQSFCHVGITAGASTPNKIIEEVTRKLCQKN